MIVKNLSEEVVRDFIQTSCDKFGPKKIKDFMEIQLMHNINEYNQFISWFSLKYRLQEEANLVA